MIENGHHPYRSEFQVAEGVTYLNCATFSPIPIQSVEEGILALRQELSPHDRTSSDFFTRGPIVQQFFSKLIHSNEPDRIAFIPSSSYGLATVANNVSLAALDELIFISDQFPSDIYAFDKVIEKAQAKKITITRPEEKTNRSEIWNEKILNAICDKTKLVCLPNVHWTTGDVFDLITIGEKCRKHDCLLIIDGTQSIGAMPFHQNKIQADAVICCGYKWLLGPYSTGLAYFGPYFDQGVPIENNWMNRVLSDDFKNLVHYQTEYRPKASRYNVGEWSNFCLLPILQKSLELLVKWTPEEIQRHCGELKRHLIQQIGVVVFILIR